MDYGDRKDRGRPRLVAVCQCSTRWALCFLSSGLPSREIDFTISYMRAKAPLKAKKESQPPAEFLGIYSRMSSKF